MTKQTTKNTKQNQKLPEIETWNQDDETVEGGIEFRQKYFKRFGAFVRADLNELILVNIDTNEETKLTQPIKMVALYAHPSISLTKGILSEKDREQWTDDDALPVARTLMSPFGKKQKSLGSFRNANLIDWIKDPEKYRQLSNRCWIIGRIKGWQNGKENIIFSFGSSAWHSFESARKILRMHSRHISTNFLELSLEQAVNDDGQKYFKPTFKIIQGANTCKEKEFAEKFGNMIQELKKEHLEEVSATENRILVSNDAIEYDEPKQLPPMTGNETKQILENVNNENELTEDDLPF